MHAIELQAGRYRHVSHIESGSDSEVFCARVDGIFGFEKLVAVKRLPLPRPEHDDARMRLIRHAVICSKLSHHNIVGVYDFYQDDTGLCLAMEMIEGASLDSILARQRGSGKPIAISTILSVASQLLEVLNYMHNARDPLTRKPLGLVHRDLNPKAIMVDRAGVVKLLGFGRSQSRFLPDTVPLWETPYIAPEVAEGKPADPSADIFSLGAILYEMMTLKPLFAAGPPPARQGRRARLEVEAWIELLPRPYQALRTILLRAVALSSRERYSSAARMAADLRPFVVPTTRSLPPDLGLRLAATAAMARGLVRPGRAASRSSQQWPDEDRARSGPDDPPSGRGETEPGKVEVVPLAGAEDSAEDDRQTEVGPVARLSPRALSTAIEASAARMTHTRAKWGEVVGPDDVPEGEGPVARLATGAEVQGLGPGGGIPPGKRPSPASPGRAGKPVAERARRGDDGDDGDDDEIEIDESDVVEAETLKAAGWTAQPGTVRPAGAPPHASRTSASVQEGRAGAAFRPTGAQGDSGPPIETATDPGDAPSRLPPRSSETLSTVRTQDGGAMGSSGEEDSLSMVFEEGEPEEAGEENRREEGEGDIETRRSSLEELEATREDPVPGSLPPVASPGGPEPESREHTAPSAYKRALVNIAGEYATAKTPHPDGVPLSPDDTVEEPMPSRVHADAPRVALEEFAHAPVPVAGNEPPLPPGQSPRAAGAAQPVRGSREQEAVEGAQPYKDTIDLPIPTKSGITLLFITPHPGLKCVVPQTGLTIGRSPTNDLVIADHRVAWHHARILWKGGRWWMKSRRNAVLFADGLKTVEVPLESGQLIQVGGARLSVLVEDGNQPGAIIDYNALLLDLVARFRHIILDESFRRSVGLELSKDDLRAAPSRVWVTALDRLRHARSSEGLRRLLDALLERDPGAVQVRRCRDCLARIDVVAPPVADEETASLTGR